MPTFLKIFLLLAATAQIAAAQVGVREIQANGLNLMLVYPTAEVARPVSYGEFQINVAIQAAPSKTNQRLIVMSHGTGGSSVSDHELAATLAKAGYLVAQPLHAGDNYADYSKAGPESWKTRPLEISKTIDYLSKDPLWSAHFDPQKVGVHGMSAGGLTTLTVSGGQWNMLTMLKHCAKNVEEDIGFCLNGLQNDKEAQAKRRAQYISATNAPELFLPKELKTLHTHADSRVKASTLFVPLTAPLTPNSMAAITIPIGVVRAAQDGVLAPVFHSDYLTKHCKTCTVIADLKNAGHFDVLAPWPESVAKQVGAQQLRGGMPNAQFNPKDREVAMQKVVQFFNQHLK